MSKKLSLIVGTCALALAGIANAGGPVTLTNAQMDGVTAGGSAASGSVASVSSTTSYNLNFSGTSSISGAHGKSYLVGNSAGLAFDNEAVGGNSTVQGSLAQITVAGQGSSQSGQFVSSVAKNSAGLAFDNEAVGGNSTVQGSLGQITVAGQGSSQSGLFVSAGTRGR
jgi:hypothetical protein